MSSTLIATVGVIYAAIAVDQLTKGNTSMAIVFAGYAFSKDTLNNNCYDYDGRGLIAQFHSEWN
jgi:EamA domain-containing membrane protein RarD